RSSVGSPPAGWPNPPLVKILDFGLARVAIADPEPQLSAGEVLTRERAVFGTPEYMAPEQAKDSRLADIRSDIYSLGCTLYDLLAGGAPFPEGSAISKAISHIEQMPRPVEETRSEVPQDLAQVLRKMMAKDPAQRFQ